MGFTYTADIPQPGDFPSFSQPQMRDNDNYLKAFGLRDHQFTEQSSNANDGTHKSVTLTNGGTPGFIGANSVLYANSANGESNLFFNNAGIDGQLTTFKAGVPLAATPGVSCLPGGLLIQWGTDTYSDGTAVTFPVAMSACYSVVATYAQVSTQGFISIIGQTTTGFSFNLRNDQNSAPLNSRVISWIAIGAA